LSVSFQKQKQTKTKTKTKFGALHYIPIMIKNIYLKTTKIFLFNRKTEINKSSKKLADNLQPKGTTKNSFYRTSNSLILKQN
jgi:hypothetical protein